MIENDKVIIYCENTKNLYNLYMLSSNKDYTNYIIVFNKLFPKTYTENTSYYRISRIYNEYRKELLHTIQMYKEKSMSRRKVCMNFCFAGPPGTSKTYAARAIAKELGREIFEINLSKIVFEEEFLALFTEENIKKYVYLLDEIDLMCPSREFDDKLIKSAEETRLTTFGVNTKSIATESENEESSLTEEDGYGNVNKQLLHKINLLQEDIRKLHEKMEKTFDFQEWLKSYLTHFCQTAMEFLYIIVCKSCNVNLKEIVETNFLEGYKNNYFTESNGITKIKSSFIEEKTISFFNLNTGFTSNTSNSSSEPKSQDKTPFTLRTLLNFISGGNTHDDLVIIATTNRVKKLDPALIRPGRLRLVEFKNLRKVDAVSMLLENYPEQRDAIERGLDEIGYEDYMSNGALLEAVMSSTSTLEKTLQTFQRELSNIQNY
jgi:SpoVK/Ycf46/Vps4 family AAA+-type ATPase